MTVNHWISIARRFQTRGQVLGVERYGNGNVNDTFLVTTDCETEKHLILQRINPSVFRRPEDVMQNMLRVTEHMRHRTAGGGLPPGDRWETPRVLLTWDGRDHWTDQERSCWRVMTFIENSVTFDTVQDPAIAGEVGRALGSFHELIADLSVEGLVDSLEGFHITPRYLDHYDAVEASTAVASNLETNYLRDGVSRRRSWADVLEKAKERGDLHLRPIHGDPKVNNILFDERTRRAIGLIDLDTVKPGLVHYDIGDALRSACNQLGEACGRWEKVRFEADLCEIILRAYAECAGNFLMESDYEYFFDAIRLIPFELGLRFFTDYLEGNVYFKVSSPEHNLLRALVQFRLTESIEAQESAIRSIIENLRRKNQAS